MARKSFSTNDERWGVEKGKKVSLFSTTDERWGVGHAPEKLPAHVACFDSVASKSNGWSEIHSLDLRQHVKETTRVSHAYTPQI
jgi:hypothetical protein